MKVIGLMIDGFFITDMFINFVSAYEDDDKNIEFRMHKIAINYLKGWFLIDIVSNIPFQLMDQTDALSSQN